MMGSNPSAPAEATVNAGLYVLAARDIFTLVKRQANTGLEVYGSCFEIYGGKLFDLLNDRTPVKCLEDAKQQVQLPGLSEHELLNVEHLLNMMAMAHGLRSTGCTGANEESSRSHMVLQIVVKGTKGGASSSSGHSSGPGRGNKKSPPSKTIMVRKIICNLSTKFYLLVNSYNCIACISCYSLVS